MEPLARFLEIESASGILLLVCTTVALVAQQRSYRTLERLCSAIADRLLDVYDAEEVWVKAAKPEPPIPLPVQEVSVEVWRQAAED